MVTHNDASANPKALILAAPPLIKEVTIAPASGKNMSSISSIYIC